MSKFWEYRLSVAAALSLGAGAMLLHRVPFPADHALLLLVYSQKPWLYYAIRAAYLGMAFTTPFFLCSMCMSVGYIFLQSNEPGESAEPLPLYPEPADRDSLFLIVGEIHRAKRAGPSAKPRWLKIPELGLYTGVMVLGAVGSGKTSGCMYPFARQLFAYKSRDKSRRPGGLVLEVKGDFCHKVRSMLEDMGRGNDYLELSLQGEYRYNPLHGELDAYTLAFGIASLMNNVYGKGKEPFWQQAYTNLVKFVILLHQVLYDYVTLFDVYQGAINPELLEEKIKEGEARFSTRSFLIPIETYLADEKLETFGFDRDSSLERMKAAETAALRDYLTSHQIEFEVLSAPARDSGWDKKRQQFEAVKRWFYQDWQRIEARLRTSIVEGISVFLSLFDDNPDVNRVFCPPKETYDPIANAGGQYGIPFPPFPQSIEAGVVCALNLPVAANPGLAKAIGTLMKQDFQRAVLNRIPQIERSPEKTWRQTVFICDEYHAFATVGENDPSGDEKFFALSRQARCIPIVASQSLSSLRSTLPGETWRTLLQTFRTKIFLALSDDFSARTASDLCGKEDQLKLHYNLSESGQDAGVSVMTGRAAAHRASLSASKGYHLQRDFVFEAKTFSELRNAQAIVLVYDGVNPLPPTFCYLKPYYLDPNVSYFDYAREGAL